MSLTAWKSRTMKAKGRWVVPRSISPPFAREHLRLCVTARARRRQPVRIYFVPYLSGIRLLKKPSGFLPRSASVGAQQSDAAVVFQYYEYERVQDRLPFAMKIQELQQQVRPGTKTRLVFSALLVLCLKEHAICVCFGAGVSAAFFFARRGVRK